MITRTVLKLTGVSVCLLWGLAANTGMAEASKDKKPKAPKALELSDVKVTHPCARKSVKALNKKASPYLKSIRTHAKKYGVDGDLVKSVITIESCYKQKALSHKGAQGLMQLIPATAERFGVSNVYDSDQNVRGGTQYLGWLSKRFGGDLQKVLAGYNAGEGRVDQYNGIPPYRETRNYVHDVLVVYNKFKSRQQVVTKKKTAEQARINQAKLALKYKKQRLAQQQKRRLAEQKRLAALTPAQRQRELKQARLAQQIRQRQQSERQKQLVAKMRQRQVTARQKQLVQHVRQQKNRPAASGGQASQTHQMITGQMSRPIRAQPAPVLRKASKKIIRDTAGKPAAARKNSGRVQRTYNSPVKPGRAGWQANKQRAPQLYKQ